MSSLLREDEKHALSANYKQIAQTQNEASMLSILKA